MHSNNVPGFKADMNSEIPLMTAAILANLYLKQVISSEYVMVDFICERLLELQEEEARVIKWKILAHSGTRTHDPWIAKSPPLLLGRQICYTINKLKFNQVLPCYL